MFIECTLEGYNQGGGPGRSVDCLIALDDVALVTPLESREDRKPTVEVLLKSGRVLAVQGNMETFMAQAKNAGGSARMPGGWTESKEKSRGGKKAT